MGLFLETSQQRPNRLEDKKNEDYHVKFGKWCLQTINNTNYKRYYQEGLTNFKEEYQVKHDTDYQKALEQAILKDLPINRINEYTFVNYPPRIQFIRNNYIDCNFSLFNHTLKL